LPPFSWRRKSIVRPGPAAFIATTAPTRAKLYTIVAIRARSRSPATFGSSFSPLVRVAFILLLGSRYHPLLRRHSSNSSFPVHIGRRPERRVAGVLVAGRVAEAPARVGGASVTPTTPAEAQAVSAG